MQESVVADAGGIIYVSFKEGDQLYFKNSGGVINKHSEIALYSLETVTARQGTHHAVGVKCSALEITADDAGVLRHFLIPAGASQSINHFRKLYFKPVRVSVHRRR